MDTTNTTYVSDVRENHSQLGKLIKRLHEAILMLFVEKALNLFKV